jgi:hypothetical protein
MSRAIGFVAAAGVALAVMLTATVSAIGPTPLPVTALTTLDGAASTTAALPADGQWLIVYLRPGCVPCEGLLRGVKPDQHEAVVQRTVVVVAADTAEEAMRLKENRPELAAATWFVDADQSFAQALELREAPVVLGMSGRTVQWSLGGVFTRGTRTADVMTSWLERSIQ